MDVELNEDQRRFREVLRDFTDRDVRADRTLELKHGEPMIFGKERDRGIVLRGTKPEVVTLGGDVTGLVPDAVRERLEAWFRETNDPTTR